MTVECCNVFAITCDAVSQYSIQTRSTEKILHQMFPAYEFTVVHDVFESPFHYKVLIETTEMQFDRVLYLENCMEPNDIVLKVSDYLGQNTNEDNTSNAKDSNKVKTRICICPNCGATKNPYSTNCDWCGTVFY